MYCKIVVAIFLIYGGNIAGKENPELSPKIYFGFEPYYFTIQASYRDFYSGTVLERINLRESEPDQNLQSYRGRIQDTPSRFRFGVQGSFANFRIQLDLDLLSRPGGESEFYLGRNAFIGYKWKGSEWILGRRSFPHLEDSHPEYSFSDFGKIHQGPGWDFGRTNLDGIEGLGLIYTPLDQVVLEIYFLDLYRGFPIWESRQTPIFDLDPNPIGESGFRSRHGGQITARFFDTDLRSAFLYLNLGNWGPRSFDDQALYLKDGGDGDFLYRFEFQILKVWENFWIGLEYQIVRGVDKTFADPKRPERTLPIRGEAIFPQIGVRTKFLSVSWKGFLPNTGETSSDSESQVSMGYVGMGNSPFFGAFLSRELRYFPSAWVLESGLEQNTGFLEGRESAFGSQMRFEVLGETWVGSIYWDYLVPRKRIPGDRGEISLKKSDYTREFLSELGIGIESRSTIFDTNELTFGCEAYYLYSDSETNLSGTGIRIFAKVEFGI